MSGEVPELEGMRQAGLTDDEIRRIGSKPTGAAFLSERLEDVDTTADPALQESIRQMEEEPESLVDITPSRRIPTFHSIWGGRSTRIKPTEHSD